MRVCSAGIVSVAAFLCFSLTAKGDSFPYGSFTKISLPFNGQVLGLNDVGEFVGSYTDSSGNTHGFLDNKGVFTTLDYPGSSYTQAYAINNSGVIAGFYNSGQGSLFDGGFQYANGTFTTIVTNPQPGLSGLAINNMGAVVGTYATCIIDYCGAGFEYLNGQLATASLPFQQSYTTTLSGINDQGTIVGGFGFDPFGHSAYAMTCSSFQGNGSLNLSCNPAYLGPGVPTGINDSGEIIGNDFLYQNGVVYQLPYDPTGINNLGQIVLGGDYLFTPSPSPEPGTCWLLSLGFLGVGVMLGGRRRLAAGQ